MITYNHERYIEAALKSVLAQRTSRRVEIIVSEDRSTDGTYELVRAYAEAHPAIKVIRSETNLASNAVVARAVFAASGKYICLLDGDDFWTDAEKLQKQADILDREPSLAAVFHNATVVDGESVETASRWTPSDQAPAPDLVAMWEGNPFATCAGMLRRDALKALGPWYDDFFPITDWPLYILCASAGRIAFCDEPVGAYRLHDAGMFSSLASTQKLDQVAEFYRRMREVSPPHQRAVARAGETRYFFDWALTYERERNYPMARGCLRRALRAGAMKAVGPARFARVAWRVLSRGRSAKRAA